MLKRLLITLGVAILAIVGLFAWMMLQPPPDDLDLRTTKTTENGLYQVRFVPAEGEPAVGPISVWHFSVTDGDGNPVSGADVKIDGGMPQHGHGLPTVPASTGEIAPGVYAIDGMKFSMRGWWEFHLIVDGEAGEDKVTFNTVLE